MAKKVRLPLIMDNDVEVRSIEELQEYFSLEKVVSYIEDGKMENWLRERYLDDIADELDALDSNKDDYFIKICNIFDVVYEEPENLKERKRKIALLEQAGFASYSHVAQYVAFDQDELYDLLDEGEKHVYLCGDKFSIPIAKKNMYYYGINNPIVSIFSNEVINFEEKGIHFQGIRFDEKYQKLLDVNKQNKSDEKLVNAKTETTKTIVKEKAEKTIVLSDSALKELRHFKSSINKVIDEFKSEIDDYISETYDEEAESYDPYFDCDIDFDEYASEEEALKACKKKLEHLYKSHMSEWIESMKEYYKENIDMVLSEMEINLISLIDNCVYECEDVCDFGDGREMNLCVNKVKDNLFNEYMMKKLFADIGVLEAYANAIKEILVFPPEGFIDIDKYVPMCEVDYDGDAYTIELESAADELSDAMIEYMSDIEIRITDEFVEIGMSAISDYCDILKKKMDEIIAL